ncbi:MAG: MFS transporter [Anaerolinea sp.]|nr:MFS transporter [Anaerolinea sp.]
MQPAGTPSRAPTLRSLMLSVYFPTFLFAVGQGAVIPIVALAAKDLGASLAVAGFIVALRGIGVLVFDVPAGWLVSRFGERRAMAAGTVIVVVSLAGSAWSPSPWLFGVFTFLMGCGWSVWLLARLNYVSESVPIELRGRALSTLGGLNRVGSFVGPFAGVVAAMLLGLDGAYYLHIITAAAACGFLLIYVRDGDDGPAAAHEHINFTRVVRENASVFFTAGVGAIAIQSLRATRQSVLPLWAAHIGLDAAQVSLIFGISMAMEMTLFYPAGSAMDRWGRKSVAIPCLTIMSVGMVLLPLTGEFWSITAVGLVIGFGNGLGSGIIMTLGADFSPAIGRAQFLGAWRLCGDLGTAGGPLAVAGLTALVTLGGASVFMGGVGMFGALLILFRMPETLRRAPVVDPQPTLTQLP